MPQMDKHASIAIQFFYRPYALPVANQQCQCTEGKETTRTNMYLTHYFFSGMTVEQCCHVVDMSPSECIIGHQPSWVNPEMIVHQHWSPQPDGMWEPLWFSPSRTTVKVMHQLSEVILFGTCSYLMLARTAAASLELSGNGDTILMATFQLNMV